MTDATRKPMTPSEAWDVFVGDQDPASFVLYSMTIEAFRRSWNAPERLVARYVKEMDTLYPDWFDVADRDDVSRLLEQVLYEYASTLQEDSP